jgi:TonB family protein
LPQRKDKEKNKKVQPETPVAIPPVVGGSPPQPGAFEPIYLIDTAAKIITKGVLSYPQEYVGKDVSAVSIIDVYLDDEGEIRTMEIVESGGRVFDAAAFRMIVSSTFAPAYSGGSAVPCVMRITVEFETVIGS